MSRPQPILPIDGVSPALLQQINTRLRQIVISPSIATKITSPASTVTTTSPSTGLKSPLNFGAAGDGVTDDTAAVATAAALGYLWLPPGYEFVTGKLTITGNDYNVFGGGGLKLKAGAGTDLLVFDGSAFTGSIYPGNGQYGHIFDVTLHGNAGNQPINLGSCLVLKNSAYTTVSDCLIYAGSGDGIRVENANGCFQADEVNILNNRCFSNGRHGIYLHSTCLYVNTTIAANIGTTIAANVAVGIQTVTPASMAFIGAGSVLPIQNSDGSNFENVLVTGVTLTTFTAKFAITKTGPGIIVGGSQVVNPASMVDITVGATLIVANSDGSHLEYVVVTAITPTTFTAIFNTLKTGPGITVISTFGHVGDHVIWGNHCNYNNIAGIRGTFLTSGVIAFNNILTNAVGLWLDGADRCSVFGNPCRNNKGSGVIIDQHSIVAYTDLVIVTSTTVSSALKPFSDEDIGLQLTITGGTGFTVQTVNIVGVAGGGVATVSLALGTVGSTGGIGSRTGFGRSKQCLVSTNQLHYNNVQTPQGDDLDVFNTDGCSIVGNFMGDTDFTPLDDYGIQLFNCTGILIASNIFGPTLHGPLLAPINAATGPVATTIAANVGTGFQEVTPASMANIILNAVLLIQNSDDSNQETVAVTAITGATFTANFALSKTGPGIKVKANTSQQPYRSIGNIGLSDGMQANQAILPTPALNDYGILCTVSDYAHTLLWIGDQWVFGVAGDSSGQINNTQSAVLTGGVWHAVDGTAATILNGDGTTQSVTPGVGTTIAANVAVGLQTVTPASMVNIKIGTLLTIQNSDFTHFEDVIVTAIAATTFTATFVTTKTGPGIVVTSVAGYYIRR